MHENWSPQAHGTQEFWDIPARCQVPGFTPLSVWHQPILRDTGISCERALRLQQCLSALPRIHVPFCRPRLTMGNVKFWRGGLVLLLQNVSHRRHSRCRPAPAPLHLLRFQGGSPGPWVPQLPSLCGAWKCGLCRRRAGVSSSCLAPDGGLWLVSNLG